MNRQLKNTFVAALLLFSPTMIYAQSPSNEPRKSPCCDKGNSQDSKIGKTQNNHRKIGADSNEQILKTIAELLGQYGDQLPLRLKLELFQILGHWFSDSSVAKKELKALKSRAKKHFVEACILKDRREYPKAIVEFNQAIELYPHDGEVYYNRGLCNLKLGKRILGVLDLSRALELEPRYIDKFFNLAAMIRHYELDHVIAEVNEVVKERPNVSHVVFLRGFYYLVKVEFRDFEPSDVDKGIADFNRCLEINPAHVTAKTYRGLLFFKKRQYDKAHNDFDHAISGYPKSGITHYLKALTFAAQAGEATGTKNLELQQKSIQCLRKAFENNFRGIERIKNIKEFQSIHENQKYKVLIEKFSQ